MANRGFGSDEDDDSFLYRYSTPSLSTSNLDSAADPKRNRSGAGGSGGLAPSKSTVYVSNLDYTLTNSDLHTIFSTFGKVARVTVLKDRDSRSSRGVAFVLFASRTDAASAASAMHGKILNGRTLSASIAVDNGRAPEFIRRRVYKDKSRCYECGDEGHLSYECPRNQLGPREKPPPKKSRRGNGSSDGGGFHGGSRRMQKVRDDEGDEEDMAASTAAFEDDNWASVVDTRQMDEKAKGIEENYGVTKGDKGKKEKRVSYFSDESGDDDDD